ncbi:hypothetical protein [Leifsonia sp. P73]|uniref:hypothetical protein n=1 Tax=Leifsonia sp. P73 TaxID=3423959 RepID=UPI003DA3925F
MIIGTIVAIVLVLFIASRIVALNSSSTPDQAGAAAADTSAPSDSSTAQGLSGQLQMAVDSASTCSGMNGMCNIAVDIANSSNQPVDVPFDNFYVLVDGKTYEGQVDWNDSTSATCEGTVNPGHSLVCQAIFTGMPNGTVSAVFIGSSADAASADLDTRAALPITQ